MNKKVLFLHLDLGIGGAERAVLDAGLALKQSGFFVTYVTTHHDLAHAFPETTNGTFDVHAIGDWLPRSTFGRLVAFWSNVRMIYAALYVSLFSSFAPDLIYCDQVSSPLFVLKLFSSAKIIFYCHFPDLLLSKRLSLWQRIYRWPLDWLEERTTSLADVVLVNSRFTLQTVSKTFTSLSTNNITILYPVPALVISEHEVVLPEITEILDNNQKVILSINRYEKKKNVKLAIDALSVLMSRGCNNVHLIIVGGYDNNIPENDYTYNQLLTHAKNLNLDVSITLLKNPTDEEKYFLLKIATCLFYTPENEHFGIVPIEAMACGCPVVAANSGGPLETVVNDITGKLVGANATEFANAAEEFFNMDEVERKSVQQNCRDHVRINFSFEAMRKQLCGVVDKLLKAS